MKVQNPIQLQIGDLRGVISDTRTVTEIAVAQPIIPNPKNALQLLLQHENALYLIDTKSMKVRELRDPRATATAPANGEGVEQPGRVQYRPAEPVWSLNGEKIAYVSIHTEPQTSQEVRTLWVYDVATSQQVKVTGKNLVSTKLHGWISENSLLMTQFQQVNKETVPVIALFDAVKRSTRTLATGDMLAVSADGKIIVFGKHVDAVNIEIHAVDVAAGKTTPLLASPNGQPLHFLQEITK